MLRSAALSPANEAGSPSGLLWERDPALLVTLQSIVAESAAAGIGGRLVMAPPQGELRTVVSERCSNQSWRGLCLTVLEHGEALAQPGVAIAPIHSAAGMRGAFLLYYDFGYVASQHEYIALARSYAARVDSVLHASEASLDAMYTTAHSMLQMLAVHDSTTARHSQMVRMLAITLGQTLGLPAHELVSLEIAALLHDIGKVSVPGTLLLKDGPLSAEEWAMIRHHPAVGERIVRSVSNLSSVAPAIRHHHERWDGTGYPDRLAGTSIPLHARLVGLADAYEAMRSGRPYRQPRDRNEVFEELRRSAGTQFDPSIVSLLPILRSHDIAI
ncbi:MAG: diguanylate cyclase with sensor [Chloroflexi bacterium]|nr:diguanylate cyclase with sensor [Chloroflexota bacterium]